MLSLLFEYKLLTFSCSKISDSEKSLSLATTISGLLWTFKHNSSDSFGFSPVPLKNWDCYSLSFLLLYSSKLLEFRRLGDLAGVERSF